ncbi:MAG: hypothetical protein U0T82_15715 [Bacteroidales bacterium]
MKKYASIISAGLLLVLASCSEKVKISPEQEDSFVKYYGNLYEDYGRDVKEVPGKGYAVVGTTTTGDGTQKADKDILFLLVDKSGNLRRDPITFGSKLDDEGNSLALTSDRGFVIAGTCTDTLSLETDVIVIRLDQDGNTLWTKVIAMAGNQNGNSVIISSQGKILVGGVTNNGPLLLTLEDAENGSVNEAEKSGTAGYLNSISDIQEFQGGTWLYGQVSNDTINTAWVMVAFSTESTSLESISPPEKGNYQKAFGSCILEPDTILLCGVAKGSDGKNKALIKKLYDDGTSQISIKLEKKIGEPNEIVEGKSVRMLNDGRIALLATRTKAENSDVVIYLCDRDGKVLENGTIILGDNSVQEAGAFEITSDGGFIITGSNLLDNNSMVSLIKLNAKGELQ